MEKEFFEIKMSQRALDNLNKVHPAIAIQIKQKLYSYLVKAPDKLGKPLTSDYKGMYRYQHGDYRVIYEVIHATKIVNIHKIGHRSSVY